MAKRGSHTVLIIPDVHVPFEDKEAMQCLLAVGRKLRPARTVILGDFVNGTPFSRHAAKDIKELALHDFKSFEIDPANRYLDQIQAFTKGELAYTAGNHEAWAGRAAAQLGKELASVFPLFSPKALLSAGRKRFKWVDYGRDVSLPGYHYEITPDYWAFHEITTSRHAAATTLAAMPTISTVFGHIHRAQSVTSRIKIGDKDKIVKSHSPGCLCDLSPAFMGGKPSNWIHGFSVGYVRNDLSSFVSYDITIKDGRCVLPDGSTVSA